jgi:Rrf2 family nitric oxide-sensitive transcriptional repressor
MHLTLHTDYALRVLMFVALKGDEQSTIPEIAAHFDVSRGLLMKVVHRLGQRGYLQTLRGKKGGIRLASRASQIVVGAVVRDMEDVRVLGCLQDLPAYCRITECCVLRRALRDATQAFLATLDRHTIEDLIKPRRPLLRLLQVDEHFNSRAAARA